jgi:uncharacterized protein YndB with AHSA1/START domain
MNPTRPPNDHAAVTLYINVAPAAAFEVFTAELGQWWLRGHTFRVASKYPSEMHLEPRLGGRVFEQCGTRKTIYEIGTITAWQPPSLLAFDWRAPSFIEDELTQVEVQFSLSGAGSRVRLEHSGWSKIVSEHRVRHGKSSSRFISDLYMWWTNLLRSFSQHALRTRGQSF